MATAAQELKDNEGKAHPTSKTVWQRFIGKRIVIQTRGRIIITGILKEYTSDHFLGLDEPVIIGTRKVRPPEVYVALGQVGHFHEECEMEPKRVSATAPTKE